MFIDNKASDVVQQLQDYSTVIYNLVFPVADGIEGLLGCIYILHEGLCVRGGRDLRTKSNKNFTTKGKLLKITTRSN